GGALLARAIGAPPVLPEHLDSPPLRTQLPAVREHVEVGAWPYSESGKERLEAVGPRVRVLAGGELEVEVEPACAGARAAVFGRYAEERLQLLLQVATGWAVAVGRAVDVQVRCHFAPRFTKPPNDPAHLPGPRG